MGVLDVFKKTDRRSIENPNVPVSADNFFQLMGFGNYDTSSGVTVNIETALGVPALWSAVNFISGTLAGLPLEVYRGNEQVTSGIGSWLDRAVNPALSSYDWRKYTFEQVLTGGRSATLIIKSRNGDISDLVPIDPANLTVSEAKTDAGFPSKTYQTKTAIYQAEEIIDLTFMVKNNQIDHRGPIMTNRDIIGLAIASARYGSKAFQSGGIPPALSLIHI